MRQGTQIFCRPQSSSCPAVDIPTQPSSQTQLATASRMREFSASEGPLYERRVRCALRRHRWPGTPISAPVEREPHPGVTFRSGLDPLARSEGFHAPGSPFDRWALPRHVSHGCAYRAQQSSRSLERAPDPPNCSPLIDHRNGKWEFPPKHGPGGQTFLSLSKTCGCTRFLNRGRGKMFYALSSKHAHPAGPMWAWHAAADRRERARSRDRQGAGCRANAAAETLLSVTVEASSGGTDSPAGRPTRDSLLAYLAVRMSHPRRRSFSIIIGLKKSTNSPKGIKPPSRRL